MFVEYNSQPAPEVMADQNMRPYLEELKTGKLPLSVIRGADADPEELWASTLRQMNEAGFTGNQRVFTHSVHEEPLPGSDSSSEDSKDSGLHLDIPPDDRFEITSLRLHQLLGGAYTALFFEIAEEYSAPSRGVPWDHFNTNRLPSGTEEYYRKGLVDPTVLSPTAYKLEAQTGDIAIFRQGGRLPVAHDFRTTAFPRVFRTVVFGIRTS